MFDKQFQKVGAEYPKVHDSKLKNFQSMQIILGDIKSTIRILDKERMSNGKVVRQSLYTVSVNTIDLGRQARALAYKYRILRDAVEVIQGEDK